MTHVWIAQCLCGPNRHAILAAVGEFETEDEARCLLPGLRSVVDEKLGGGLNPWCGLCGAKAEDWRYELGRTRFATMEEAQPHLEMSQASNMLANELFGTHGPTPPKRQ